MSAQSKVLSSTAIAVALLVQSGGPAFAQGNAPVWTYAPYERSGGDSGDPFASGDAAVCRSQYENQVRQIEAAHQQGGQGCHHPNNAACHAANNRRKREALQSAGQQLYDCNRQTQAARGQATRTDPAAQTRRVDYEAIRQQEEERFAREQVQYARAAEAARAREAAAARAAESARRREEYRRWQDANRFVDVLTGRRPPFP